MKRMLFRRRLVVDLPVEHIRIVGIQGPQNLIFFRRFLLIT